MRRCGLIGMLLAVALCLPSGIHAQLTPVATPTDSVSAPAAGFDSPAGVVMAPSALPPNLTPSAFPKEVPIVVQERTKVLPLVLGIFGGIAGMFVADWWADRNCVEACGQANIPALFLGGALGALIGWVVGGGEIPDEESPPRRWP